MTKTYTERRQATYFTAAREMYRLAASILDDVREDAEFTGSTLMWATSVANGTFEQGRALENLGHEQTVASAASENANYRARQVYEKAHQRFVVRKEAADRRRVAA